MIDLADSRIYEGLIDWMVGSEMWDSVSTYKCGFVCIN